MGFEGEALATSAPERHPPRGIGSAASGDGV
jgi:hypothetical protein